MFAYNLFAFSLDSRSSFLASKKEEKFQKQISNKSSKSQAINVMSIGV